MAWRKLDENFNFEAGEEGNGSDHIFYHIPMDEFNEKLTATAKIYYQTAPPKWMKEMFDEQTEEIDFFKEMFLEADRSPILLKTKSIEVEEIIVSTDLPANVKQNTFLVNNFSNDGIYRIKSKEIHDIRVVDLKGNTILHKKEQSGDYKIKINSSAGLFLVIFYTKTGKTITQKIVKH